MINLMQQFCYSVIRHYYVHFTILLDLINTKSRLYTKHIILDNISISSITKKSVINSPIIKVILIAMECTLSNKNNFILLVIVRCLLGIRLIKMFAVSSAQQQK